MNKNKLCELAVSALSFSYSPYSSVSVGAALLAEDGSVYTGCNIENSAYSPTVCAERTAFFKAVSDGKRIFDMIAIAATKNGELIEKISPCGVCRQVMAEFCRSDFKILLVQKSGYREFALSQLLPEAFILKE